MCAVGPLQVPNPADLNTSDPQLVESKNADSLDTEGPLYCVILFRGLEDLVWRVPGVSLWQKPTGGCIKTYYLLSLRARHHMAKIWLEKKRMFRVLVKLEYLFRESTVQDIVCQTYSFIYFLSGFFHRPYHTGQNHFDYVIFIGWMNTAQLLYAIP